MGWTPPPEPASMCQSGCVFTPLNRGERYHEDYDNWLRSGKECFSLEMVPDFKPQIALLDIGLPDISGYELARRLRLMTQGSSVTLIAATGWGQERDRQLAFDAGFDHHVTKPVDLEQLRLLLVSDFQ